MVDRTLKAFDNAVASASVAQPPLCRTLSAYRIEFATLPGVRCATPGYRVQLLRSTEFSRAALPSLKRGTFRGRRCQRRSRCWQHLPRRPSEDDRQFLFFFEDL